MNTHEPPDPLMDRLHIRGFEPDDLRELVPMWRQSFEHGVGIVDPNPIAAQVAYFHEQVLPTHAVRVALDGDRLVGFCASNAEWVSQLHVRVEYIGQGIGSRLLDVAKQHSAGGLWLYTFARNTNARRFYERRGVVAVAFGFEPVWQLDDVKYRWVDSTQAVAP
jgi:ribosomal protein S18 acetylase RimI-like enzyme